MGIGWRAPRRQQLRTHLQTLCFVEQNDQVLLLYRRFPPNVGLWNCPGGKVEAGETPTEACIREVYEETGLNILNPRLRAVVTLAQEGQQSTTTTLMFVYHATDFVGEPRESREGFLEWLPTKYLSDEPEIVRDVPLLYEECRRSVEVLTARLRSEGPISEPKLVPDRPLLAF